MRWMRRKSLRRSGLGGEESLASDPAVQLGRLCSLQSRADLKSNCESFDSLRCTPVAQADSAGNSIRR